MTTKVAQWKSDKDLYRKLRQKAIEMRFMEFLTDTNIYDLVLKDVRRFRKLVEMEGLLPPMNEDDEKDMTHAQLALTWLQANGIMDQLKSDTASISMN